MEKSRKNLVVSLNIHEIEEKFDIYGYLFDKFGKLVSKKKVIVKGNTGRVDFPVKKIGRYTLKIAGDVEQIRELEKLKPVTKSFYFTGETLHLHFDIPKIVWVCWLKLPYVIKGFVKKDGYPICIGEVDIYEVDYRFCFLRIPEDVLDRLKKSIIDEIVNPRFPCGIIPCPQPEIPKPPIPPERFVEPVQPYKNFLNLSIGKNLKLVDIVYSDTENFRRLLIENIHNFKYYLCLPWIYPIWFPYCYKMDKIATATLNSDGSFQVVVWMSICEKDKPDLYFKVKQKINNTERVIYNPKPVPCFTYWNHPSGKEVYINVTYPEAIVCHPHPNPDVGDVYIMPLGIGWDGWHQISHAHLKTGHITDFVDTGLYNGEAPYGKELDIQMQFHEDLRNKGVRYYRWSYRKGESGRWKNINSKVVHRYLQLIGTDLFINTKVLGPFTVNGNPDLFEIPDPDIDWVIINRGDRRFAYWETEDLEDGVYQLRLEVFDQNGNKITDPSSKGFKFILPTGNEQNGVIPVDDNLKVIDGSIILNIHINNRKTVADIKGIRFNGLPLNQCQFVEYFSKNQILTITYTAKHPVHTPVDFLRSYVLTIRKGINGTLVKNVSANYSVENENLNIALSEILGNDDRCSYSIQLHTYPKTRNGYSTIREYEDHDISSFAVVPK